jgi:hypothetical protein
MTLGLFWSRYELELHEKNLREIDAKYTYLIHYEMWNWLIAKIPEKVQVQILRGHNHGEGSWSCRQWVEHMLEWLKENKPADVYNAVLDKIEIVRSQKQNVMWRVPCLMPSWQRCRLPGISSPFHPEPRMSKLAEVNS